MAEFSSPLSRENRIQLARSTFSSSSIVGGRSLSISPLISTAAPQQDPETLRILESNQVELAGLTQGIASLRNNIDSLNQSLNSISSVIYSNSVLEQSRELQKQQQERILAEDALRDETEALIERKTQSSITAAVEPVAEKTTGTLNSLMGVFGALFLGWLTTGGIQQVQSFVSESDNRLSNVKNIVGSGLGFVGNGLLSIKSGFDDAISNIGKVTTNIKDAVTKGLIIAPFSALFGGGKKTPPPTPPPAAAPPKPSSSTGTSTSGAGSGAAAAATKGAASEVAEDGLSKTFRGIRNNMGGIASLAFGGLDFMERKGEGQTTTQAAAGTGAGMAGGILGAKTGSAFGSLFGPIGSLMGGIGGGALGWMGASGLADRMTGVTQEGQEPSPLPKPAQQSPQAVTPPPSEKPEAAPQVQPQLPIISPIQIQNSETKAEDVTPKANFSVNFGDQISNYTTKMQSSSEDSAEMKPPSEKIPDWMNSMRESIKTFDLPFDTSRAEDSSPEIAYKLSEIGRSSKISPPKQTTFGPLPEVSPNIIVSPVASTQQSGSGPMRFTGSASNVPFISSSNPDNLYVLYSRSQYNVVA